MQDILDTLKQPFGNRPAWIHLNGGGHKIIVCGDDYNILDLLLPTI